ncbi:MAG: hypothetical protein KDD69_04475 [Bdellovibrionales bacterium]|nr:hypothetical protein [Bdellovibrionales bacterium]
MIGIYLLVTLFTQFSPQHLWVVESGPTEVSVEFEQLNGIKIGSPVLAEGQLIGNVSRISPIPFGRRGSATVTGITLKGPKDEAFVVSVKIAPHHRGLLRKGTVALIKSPLSTSRVAPEAVVELLLPVGHSEPVLKDGASIVGYSSFEEFWSADFSARGVEAGVFNLG